MRNDLIGKIYSIARKNGEVHSIAVEEYFGLNEFDVNAVSEYPINEYCFYRELFVKSDAVAHVYANLRSEIKGISFEAYADKLQVLIFLQHIVAKAMWKYHIDVGGALAGFARDFDRLDVLSEQYRFYKDAQ